MTEQSNHFAVVFRVDHNMSAIFEGTEAEIYHWLVRQSNRAMWEVWEKRFHLYHPAEDFVARLAEKYKPKSPLTEEDVRRIVDKRVGEILETMAKEAEDRAASLAAYGVDEFARTAFAAVYQLLENITDRLAAANDREKGLGGQ